MENHQVIANFKLSYKGNPSSFNPPLMCIHMACTELLGSHSSGCGRGSKPLGRPLPSSQSVACTAAGSEGSKAFPARLGLGVLACSECP